ncbi:MAG: hypothetical protein A2137_07970 [Chloroflexi bacterium RBG_16_58_8]|nr:MAG: hypothetical protein A2137_07970 [Chloroflexi bacterium RBG_16_58_8]
MAEILPFHGIHYNPAQVKDLAKVICPPYDVISPQLQQELYQSSEFNFVRIEYGRELPQDTGTANKYTRALAVLQKWQEQGVLTTDEQPAIYIADHSFLFRGKKYRRRGITCLVKLEEWETRTIRPHEGTLSRAKNDRLNMLWTLEANTSPVMALFEDSDRKIAARLDSAARGKSLLGVNCRDGEKHRVWAVKDPGVIRWVQEYLAGQPLYIADGHHRYESALSYRRARHGSASSGAGLGPFDFVMMTLIDFADPGLVILPAHRLVRGLPQSALDILRTALKICFSVEEYPLDKTGISRQIENLLAEGENEVNLVLYGLKNDTLLRLTLKDWNFVRLMMPYFHSELYQRLDASIVDHVILEELLGLSHDTAGSFLDFTNNIQDAVNRVDERETQLAIIVNPVKPGDIKSIADSGDRMPRKSTYFFPKIPAGLVFYRFK